MSQAQTSLTIAAPGFLGLNTEASQTDLPDGYAQVADNCVIDQRGRIAARKGLLRVTEGGLASNEFPATAHCFLGEDGSEVTWTTAGLKVLRCIIGGAFVDETPVGATITNPHWQMLTLNDKLFFIQKDHTPMYFNHTGGGAGSVVVNTTSMPRAQCGVSAFGRLWLANTDTDNHQVVYYSSRLDGTDFDTNPPADSGRDSGSFNVSHYWPTGFDTIQALAAHNGSLIIFGKNNIIIYNNAEGNPAAAPSAGGITLGDTVGGIGCVARDSVASTGLDILFLDRTGVRSLGRVIQEKSMPVGEVSANIRTELRANIKRQTDADLEAVRGVYVPSEALYLLSQATRGVTYAFSTAHLDERGAMRVTRWPVSFIMAGCVNNAGDLHLTDLFYGMNQYTGYLDLGASYSMRYSTNYLTFGDPSKLKHPKSVSVTVVTAQSNPFNLLTSYDYSGSDVAQNVSLVGVPAASEYNVAEFGIGEMGAASVITTKKTNIGGSGSSMRLSIETSIQGGEFSIQQITINTLLGRKI